MEKYSTLFEYIIANIDNNYELLLESKADIEYDRNFNSIPRDIFDKIVLMDPKTQVTNHEVQNIGFGSKQFLLPKYISGETDFINTPEVVTSALTNYYPNIAKYPKFNEFRSVADFLLFMSDPENSTIDKAEQESKLDKIYKQYYSAIPKEIFNRIIAMDSNTDTLRGKIGEIARNLLLNAYISGEHDFIDKEEQVKNAIDNFYLKGHTYPDNKDKIENFESVEEFITYIPKSPTLEDVPHLREGVDYELVASSAHYDVFKILSWPGSRDLAHARGADNVWCTAGGSSGNSYIDGADGISMYYKKYQVTGDSQLYEIIHRLEPKDRSKNYNLALNKQDGRVREFRDGDNNCPGTIVTTPGYDPHYLIFFKQCLTLDQELITALRHSSDNLIRNCPAIADIYDLIKYSNMPIEINSKQDFSKLFNIEDIGILRGCVKEVIINNIEEIPFGIFANFSSLNKIVLGEGLKRISGQAFKNCVNLQNVAFPESLEYIGAEAFAGCVRLRCAIRIPDATTEIGQRGFAETHCKLKINKARKTKLKMSRNDMEWIKSHVQSIKVQ